MKTKLAPVLAMGLVLAAGSTLAIGGAARASDKTLDECITKVQPPDLSETAISRMRDCYGIEGNRQKRVIADLYKRALSKMTPDQQARLTAEQHAWQRKVDRQCVTEKQADAGGSLSYIEADDCWIEMNTKRIAALRRLAK